MPVALATAHIKSNRRMARLPIEKLLDGVEWTECEATDAGGTMPYATHTGVLRLGAGLELDVARLSDGRRVITEGSLSKIFELFGDE